MSYTARRHNRELTIPEEKAEEYAQMGYTVTDHNGETVAKAAVTSVADAKKELENVRKENAGLKEELKVADEQIEQLKAENAELKEKLEKQSKKPATKAATKTSEKTE